MRQAKIFYYVDTKDNTKSPFAAAYDDSELRDNTIIQKLGEELEAAGFGKKGECNSIAGELVYHGTAQHTCQMGIYEFGVDVVPMLPEVL